MISRSVTVKISESISIPRLSLSLNSITLLGKAPEKGDTVVRQNIVQLEDILAALTGSKELTLEGLSDLRMELFLLENAVNSRDRERKIFSATGRVATRSKPRTPGARTRRPR